VKERGREQLASLRTEAAMSGKWAAILSACGWGSKVVLDTQNLRAAWGRGGEDFVTTSPNATAMEEAEAGPCALMTLHSFSRGYGSLDIGGGGFGGVTRIHIPVTVYRSGVQHFLRLVRLFCLFYSPRARLGPGSLC